MYCCFKPDSFRSVNRLLLYIVLLWISKTPVFFFPLKRFYSYVFCLFVFVFRAEGGALLVMQCCVCAPGQ